jgi:ABC-type polysaccharide/polyol phosphate export permease
VATDPVTTAEAESELRVVTWRLRELRGLAALMFPINLYWDQRHVILTLVRTQIARRNRRSLLGWAWNLILPASQALILFAATRGAIRVPEATTPLEGFGIFFAAQIISQGMGEIVGRGPTLVTERPGWVKGSLFPLELLAPMAVGVSLYRIVPGGLLGIACVFLGGGLTSGASTLAAFTLGLVLAILWGTALGLVFAAVGVYLRDAFYAAPLITMGFTFISPLYIGEGATGLAGFLRDLNPLSVSMELVLNGPRWIADHSVHSVVGFVAPFLALVLAAWLFRRLSPAFADYV